MSQPTKSPKRHSYPHFKVTGLVHVYEKGTSHIIIKVQAHANINWHDEVTDALLRDGRWRLERAGVNKEDLAELLIDDCEVTGLRAFAPKHVRQAYYTDTVEAFFDGYADKSDPSAQKKRETLIRQRRLIPVDREDRIALYGPKDAATEGGAA